MENEQLIRKFTFSEKLRIFCADTGICTAAIGLFVLVFGLASVITIECLIVYGFAHAFDKTPALGDVFLSVLFFDGVCVPAIIAGIIAIMAGVKESRLKAEGLTGFEKHKKIATHFIKYTSGGTLVAVLIGVPTVISLECGIIYGILRLAGWRSSAGVVFLIVLFIDIVIPASLGVACVIIGGCISIARASKKKWDSIEMTTPERATQGAQTETV